MSEFETITYNVVNRVATITLNRPEALNAISQQMRRDLKAAIDRIESDDNVRIAVIAANGRGFSSGTDLSEGFTGYNDINEQIQAEYKPVLMAIPQSKKLYIAAIHGACAGIGLGLAMSCDFSVMADDAYLYLAFSAIGLVPDGGISYHLVRHVGYRKALQWVVEAAKLPADECLQNGLINKIVPANELKEAVQSWAELLAEGAPISQKLSKQCLQAAYQEDVGAVIDREGLAQVEASTSEDAQTAILAFFEKKKTVFHGR